jgi:protein-S-isoprenylcysteine O-methyltransferase Ste14
MQLGFWKRGGGWVLAQWLLMLAVAAVAPLFPCDWDGAAGMWVALPLFALGAGFGIGGVVALGKWRTIFPHPLPETRLVHHGVYAIVRHPLYTSLVFLSVAWALAWQSGPGLVGAVLMSAFLDAKARHEERLLRQRFSNYAGYARKVKRLIPWLY